MKRRSSALGEGGGGRGYSRRIEEEKRLVGEGMKKRQSTSFEEDSLFFNLGCPLRNKNLRMKKCWPELTLQHFKKQIFRSELDLYHLYVSCQFFFTCRFVIPTGKTEMTVTESLGRVSDVIYWPSLYKRNTIALTLTDNIMKDRLGGIPKRPQSRRVPQAIAGAKITYNTRGGGGHSWFFHGYQSDPFFRLDVGTFISNNVYCCCDWIDSYTVVFRYTVWLEGKYDPSNNNRAMVNSFAKRLWTLGTNERH